MTSRFTASHRGFRGLACLAAISSVVPGCATSASRTRAPERNTTSRALAPVSIDTDPSLDFLLSSDENDLAYKVWQRDIRQCMEAAGFDSYLEIERPPESTQPHPLDSDYAARWGYHLPEAVTTFTSPNDALAAKDPSFGMALFGTDSVPGCLASASQDSVASPPSYRSGVQQLLTLLSDKVLGWFSSDSYRELLTAWSTCLSNQGYVAATPQELSDRFSGADAISAEELDARDADLRCDTVVGLTRERELAYEKSRDQWADEHSEEIRELKSLRRIYVDKLNVAWAQGG